ncbi:hypothetical protein HHB59_07310 [Neisseria meningitidis]|uniref:hypothetical protein n=1 Tax=Neisseria meningitidis TaxID=487 RepID=UPI001C5A4DCA|nr:hypothetical protein [Neisseria meningitidis]MBW3918491.1 hypothetical protein [Neisseria meningitidis]
MPSEKHNHLIKSPACCKTDGLIGWCVFARKKRCKVVCCKISGIKCRFMPFFGSNTENIVKFEHEVLIVCVGRYLDYVTIRAFIKISLLGGILFLKTVGFGFVWGQSRPNWSNR